MSDGFDVIVRWLPRWEWVRITLTLDGNCEPGHGRLYAGLVRRDTFTLAGRGLVVMSMRKSLP